MSTLPSQFTWLNRKPIGICNVASEEARSECNPAGWFNDKGLDCVSENGKAHLRDVFYESARESIKNLKAINAQGMICWNPEGAWCGNYSGAPDYAAAFNGDFIVPILGEYFREFRKAGFLAGCCIRPVTPVDGKLIDSPTPFERLRISAAYARFAWKCRLIYIDTNLWPVRPGGSVGELVSATLFGRLHKDLALGDCLWIPEHEKNVGFGHSDASYFRHTAPYMALNIGELGTPDYVREDVAGSFSVINVNQGEPRQHFDQLVAAAKSGDIMAVNVGWPSDDLDAVGEIYRAAIPVATPAA